MGFQCFHQIPGGLQIRFGGKVAFPRVTVAFEVGRDVTLKAIQKATATDKIVLILSQKRRKKRI
jgi:ATP-dependent Lon protease